MREYQYILTHEGQSKTLTNNPAGWNRVGVRFERNWTYMSVLRNLTLSLRFARTNGGGYDFIKTAYDAQGIYAVISITINKRNPANNRYEYFYSGILDMIPGRFSVERSYIEVPIIDNRKLQLFKDRDDNEITLKKFRSLYTITIPDDTKSIDDVEVTPFSRDYTVSLPPVDLILTSEFDSDKFSRQTEIEGQTSVLSWPIEETILVNQIGADFTVGADHVIYTNSGTVAVSVVVKYLGQIRGEGFITNNSAWGYRLHQKFYINTYTDGSVLSEENMLIHHQILVPPVTSKSYDFLTAVNDSRTVTVPAGGYLAIFNHWFSETDAVIYPPIAIIFDLTNGNFSVQVTIPGATATDVGCLFPIEAILRSLQIITSETNTDKLLYAPIFGRTDSEFVRYSENGEYCYDAIFSGRMCRNYPNSPLTVKFKDLFNTFKSLYNIGLGFDNANDRFYIDRVEAFFDKNYFMFDLGEVSNLKITPLPEAYFNKLTAGYDNNGDYENLQGAFEFAVKREYSTATPVKETKDLQSKYRCDSVGIELTRKKQYVDTASEDYRDDQAIFIVRTTGSEPVIDSTVTGFPGVKMYYNTMLTPRQNAIRNGSVIGATLYKSEIPVKAQGTVKLFDMAVNGIDENSDITKDELGESLFIPDLYEFDSYINTEILNILKNNPHGFVRFSNFGVNYEGFIMKVESGDYNKKSAYSLIAKTQVDVESKIFEDGENFIFEDNENFIFE